MIANFYRSFKFIFCSQIQVWAFHFT